MNEQVKDRRPGPARSKRGVRLNDGVFLLEPVGRPTHFTRAQIRETIRELRETEWRGPAPRNALPARSKD